MKKIIQNLSAGALSLGLGLRQAIAQCDPTTEVCDPLKGATFAEVIARFTGFMFLISIPIVGIMILYGAFLMLTSLGEVDKYQKGKDVIKWAIVGFVVVAISGGVASIIQSLLAPVSTS